MAELVNPKMEKFCQGLARGRKQGRAYVEAGYAASAAAASRMAASKEVRARVKEIRETIHEEIRDIAVASPDEVPARLSDLGVTLGYVGQAYKLIYEQALRDGSYSAANAAMMNLQKLVEMEHGRAEDPAEDGGDGEGRVRIKDAIKLIEAMAKVTHGEAGGDARVVHDYDDDADLFEDDPPKSLPKSLP